MLTLQSLLSEIELVDVWPVERARANMNRKASAELQSFVANLGKAFPHKTDATSLAPYALAAYDYGEDCILLRSANSYKTQSELVHSFLHEAAHATGHRERLNRALDSIEPFGDSYAIEEITAELTVLLLWRHFGIKGREGSSLAYIKNFLYKLPPHPSSIARVEGALKDAIEAFKYLLMAGAPVSESKAA